MSAKRIGAAPALLITPWLVLLVSSRFTPRGIVYVLRALFERGGRATTKKLAPFVPPGITERLDLTYGTGRDERLDVFLPPEGCDLSQAPVIIWVHGGAWFSGDKDDIANYLRVLAGSGIVAIGVNHSLSPKAVYPTAVTQVLRAVAYVGDHLGDWDVSPSRVFLAGDSSGAQLAAQAALIITNRSYADQIDIASPVPASFVDGMVLFCGAYDLALVGADRRFSWLTRMILWPYFGRKDFLSTPKIELASIGDYADERFPRAFISAGNVDPLAPFSVRLADQLEAVGVEVTRLFFAANERPRTAHEYQFALHTPAGQAALTALLVFVKNVESPRGESNS